MNNCIALSLNDVKVFALVDSGASRSAISKTLMERLKLKPTPLSAGESRHMLSANGSMLRILGTVDLMVDLAGVITYSEFYVLDSTLIHDCFLGVPFLTETDARPEFGDRAISFFKRSVHMNLLPVSERGKHCVALLTNVVFPARTETLVPVRSAACFNDVDCLIESLPASNSAVLIPARALVTPRNGRTFCRVINPSDKDVRLRRNFRLAQLQRFPAAVETCTSLSGPYATETSAMADASDLCTLKESELSDHASGDDSDRYAKLKELGIDIDANTELDDQQRFELKELLLKNANVFAATIFDLPGTKMYEHVIETGEARPIRQRQYRLTPEHREEAQRQCDQLLEAGLIEPSTSMWNSPLLIVSKRGLDASGKPQYRMCIDYRKLNAVTQPMNFPLPLLTDIVQSVGEAKAMYLSSLDMRAGYHQVPLAPGSKEKTTFTTPDGRSVMYTVSSIWNFQSSLCLPDVDVQGLPGHVFPLCMPIFGRYLGVLRLLGAPQAAPSGSV